MKVISAVLVLLAIWSVGANGQLAENFYVIISGDTVHIWNGNVEVNCGCRFRMDAEVSNDTITITEVDTSSNWAHCMCTFSLCASLTGLNPGTYVVLVFREMSLFHPDSIFYVGSTSFIYAGVAGSMAVKSYQSACSQINHAGDEMARPEGFRLTQNFPNPFNAVTIIRYEVPVESYATITVHSILGQTVATLAVGVQQPGEASVTWDGNDAAGLPVTSGVYVCRLTASRVGSPADRFIDHRRMLIMR
jgi:hypothetical protein